MPFSIDLWFHRIEQLVSIAPVENGKADSSKAENKRGNTGVSNRYRPSVILQFSEIKNNIPMMTKLTYFGNNLPHFMPLIEI